VEHIVTVRYKIPPWRDPMRNIVQLALWVTLLATQVNVPQLSLGNVAAADTASANAAGVYEVKLKTNTAEAVELVGPQQPNFDAEVLDPLHAAQAAAAAKKARVRRATVKVTAVPTPGSHTDWMRAAGIAESDFGYVDYIISHESGWVAVKYNYAGSGAYGLGQAYPASKMAPYGADYMTNPVTQLKWADAYAKGRFGSWAKAYAYWLTYHRW
jgi:hypothetical protein